MAGLIPGHPENAIAVILHRHAELFQGVHGHIHIAPALQRGGEADLRVAGQQRQGVKQAGDKLGGHIPRQGVYPGGEPTADRERIALLPVGDALLPEDGEIGLLGPLHQAAAAGEHAAAPDGQGHRDEKAQG